MYAYVLTLRARGTRDDDNRPVFVSGLLRAASRGTSLQAGVYMPRRCANHSAAAQDPYVAHCLTGAVRSFAEPRVFGSIKESLIDSMTERPIHVLSSGFAR